MQTSELNFSIEVPEIVRQGRPRFTTKRKIIWVYYDEKTRRQRKLLVDLFRAGYPNVQVDDKAQFKLFITVIKGKSKGRVDLDNVIKIVMDAFTGIIWKDDSQVSSVTAAFENSKQGESKTIVLVVKEPKDE